jgi:N-acetylglucosamine malate deacetylase 1
VSQILNVVIVGAHPDDCEVVTGGTTVLLRQLGHRVTYIVTTNGNAGHNEMTKSALQTRRFEETRKVAACLDINYEVMDIDDGCLEPSLNNRQMLIRLLRKYQPDVIITHPLDDYHPDHRYTSQLVADTAYMLSVPLCVPDVPVTRKPVVYCHICARPQLDAVTILVPTDKVMDKKILAVHQNTSQIYEWLPWTENIDPDVIPRDEQGRLEYLKRRWIPEWEKPAINFRGLLEQQLGSKAGGMRFFEAFSVSRLGFSLTRTNAMDYFPIPGIVIV